MAEQTSEGFAHTPFVCGYLGPDAGGHWESLRAAAPTRVQVRSVGRVHGFAASRAPGLERIEGKRAWVWNRHLTDERPAGTWQDAAQDLRLAGFWLGRRWAASAHRLARRGRGLRPVLDGTTYFANRVDPLVRLGTARLHIDWEGWADQLLLFGMSHPPHTVRGDPAASRLPPSHGARIDGRARRVRGRGRPGC